MKIRKSILGVVLAMTISSIPALAEQQVQQPQQQQPQHQHEGQQHQQCGQYTSTPFNAYREGVLLDCLEKVDLKDLTCLNSKTEYCRSWGKPAALAQSFSTVSSCLSDFDRSIENTEHPFGLSASALVRLATKLTDLKFQYFSNETLAASLATLLAQANPKDKDWWVFYACSVTGPGTITVQEWKWQ